MIPCCCICGSKANGFHDSNWRKQDFCPKHGKLVGKLEQYCVIELKHKKVK